MGDQDELLNFSGGFLGCLFRGIDFTEGQSDPHPFFSGFVPELFKALQISALDVANIPFVASGLRARTSAGIGGF